MSGSGIAARTPLVHRLIGFVDTHPVTAALAAAFASVCLSLFFFAARSIAHSAKQRGWTPEAVGTVLAAGVATGVSAQGMWMFMRDILYLPPSLRVAFFSFLEIMVLTSALRARTAQRAGTPGQTVDGIAMWVVTGLSALLSATDADNFGTMIFRLTAPLVAAWGWERSLALERRGGAGFRRSGIRWAFGPERLLIRMGLADPDPGRTPSAMNAHRNLLRLALAVDDVHAIRRSGTRSMWRDRRARHRLRRALRRATSQSSFIQSDHRDRYAVLVEHIAVLRSADALVDLDPPSPWHTVHCDRTDRSTTPDALLAPRSSPAEPVKDTSNERNGSNLHGRLTAPGLSLRSDAHHSDRLADQATSAIRNNDVGEVDNTDYTLHTEPLHNAAQPIGCAVHSDVDINAIAVPWADLAAKVCADDPARRRTLEDVQEILRLWHQERRTYPQIAHLVPGYSAHAVGRVVRQARHHLADSGQVQPDPTGPAEAFLD